jgi:hypothetical protein
VGARTGLGSGLGAGTGAMGFCVGTTLRTGAATGVLTGFPAGALVALSAAEVRGKKTAPVSVDSHVVLRPSLTLVQSALYVSSPQ